MAKMKYSEMPRDLSADSFTTLSLACSNSSSPSLSPPESEVQGNFQWTPSPSNLHKSTPGQPGLKKTPSLLNSGSFRVQCLGQRASPSPDASPFHQPRPRLLSPPPKLPHSSSNSSEVGGAERRPQHHIALHHSLPRPASKSHSLPASARHFGLACWEGSSGSIASDTGTSPAMFLTLTRIPAEDLAVQLTLLDIPVFQAISPEELTSCGWNKRNKLELAPNVVAFTRRFNHVIFWTVQEILNAGSVRRRAEVVSHFIKIAKKLHDINNLHSQFAILSALKSAAIFRLNKTWAAVPKKDMQLFDKLCELFSDDSNWEKLREHMDSLRIPCVPYLGLFLTDLIYIDVVHPHSGGLESQQRQLKMNNILRILSSYQQSDYSQLPFKPHLQQYLLSVRYIEELQKLVEDDHYKLSLKLEPPTNTNTTTNTTHTTPHSSSSSSKESVVTSSTEANAMASLNLSPARGCLPYKNGQRSDERSNSHFVLGHRKARSLGTKFRSSSLPRNLHRKRGGATNGNHAPLSLCLWPMQADIFRPTLSSIESGNHGSLSMVPNALNGSESVANQGFDASSRSLLDGSLLDETYRPTPPPGGPPPLSLTLAPSCRHCGSAAYAKDVASTGEEEECIHVTRRGSGISVGSDEVPLPPEGCCRLQGVLRRKTVLKEGRRPTFTSWQCFWVQLWGTYLILYPPKSLRGAERSDFRREPTKMVRIVGWALSMGDSCRKSDSFQLIDPIKGNIYKFRSTSAASAQDWYSYLCQAVHGETERPLPANLMSFE